MPQHMVNGVLNGVLSDKFTQSTAAPYGFTDINNLSANFGKYQTNGVAIIGICDDPLSIDTLSKFGLELNNIKGIIIGPSTTVSFTYFLYTKDGSLMNQLNNQMISFTSPNKVPKCILGTPVNTKYYTITKEDIIDKMSDSTNYINSCTSSNNSVGCMINSKLPPNSVPYITGIQVSYSTAIEGFDNNVVFIEENNNNSLYITLLIVVILLISALLIWKYM
jgi:hypothetical protein